MARKGGPALYELMSRGGAASDPGAARATSGGRIRGGGLQPFAGSDAKWLAWASVFAVALVAAYFVGVTRGERVGRAQAIAEREEELRLLSEGAAVVLTEHSNCERGYLPTFAARLRAARGQRQIQLPCP